eukprot:SM004718S16675  [mRNA]  locus=s4718:199:527:- [translate_table: standard]
MAGALPVGQNSPAPQPRGLYAEQISGTAFTVPRRDSLRSGRAGPGRGCDGAESTGKIEIFTGGLHSCH